MGSMSVSSCRCCMFVSCVHLVAVLNVELCMTCCLLMLVEDARGDNMEEAYSRAGLLLFTPSVAITERRDMGLYEMLLPMSLLGFWDGDYVSQLPYVRYYVVVKSSFKHTREECESKRAYVF